MSVENVRAAIDSFLATKSEQVLCVRGAWGTGKTYMWDTALKAAARDKKVPFEKYAKVSLFGLNSVKEIKREIFQSTRPLDSLEKEFDITDYRDLYSGLKSSGWLSRAVSFFGDNAMDAAIEAASLLTRDQLLCFDDLERKGDELRSMDVLGFISQLREERKCKIALLLNDEQLEDKDDFESYLEKVIDVHIRFQPTFKEVADIAIDGDEDKIGNLVKEFSTKLGISNVRVIKKLHGLANLVAPLLAGYTPTVTTNAVRSITLFGWSYFQPDIGPPLDYLRKVNTYAADKDRADEDLRWRDTLRNINFYSASDFDEILLAGIQNGYFSQSDITLHAKKLNEADILKNANDEMRAAWSFYHNSFNRSADVVLGRLFDTYKRLSNYMSLNDAAQLERLFRELGDPRALEFIDMYAAAHADTPSAFELSHVARLEEEFTPEVVEKLRAARMRQRPELTPDELFLALAEKGFNEEVVVGTAKLPVEDYIRVLKSYEDQQLSDITDGLRQYLTVSNPTSEIETILEKAAVALMQIGRESPINARRAERLGIIERLRKKKAAYAAQFAEIMAMIPDQMQEPVEVEGDAKSCGATIAPPSTGEDNSHPPEKKPRARKP